jgi:hypothetical protein
MTMDTRGAVDNDHIDFALDQVGGQVRYPSVVSVGGSPLDHHIASLGIASVK